ncbi:hypothetical protein Tco_0686953 [Tanacetum coccineum]
MVEGEKDEESYASEFADSMLNDDDDSGTRIDPGSHKEHPKIIDDDDETEKEKKDNEKANDDEKKDEMGSMKTRKEKMQTPIPSPTRSPRKNLFSDKTLSQELTETISPSTATTSKVKIKSKAKSKARSAFIKSKILPGSIAGMCRRCGLIRTHLKSRFTNEMLKEEVPRLVNLVVNRDREIAPTNKPELILKEFRTFNEEARLSIHHWKDSWHKRRYKLNQRRVRDNPEEYFSNHMITEVVKITTDQQHGLDYMEQSLINLTAPTLTFPGIEVHDPYSIVDKPYTGLIYLNIKEEKKVMYLAEIVKFYDATLERVLKEVKLKIFKSEPGKKSPLLGKLDLDILKAFEREISKRLRHRVQIRS